MDTIKLQILAGQATATPPVGPLLGQKGVSAIEFCKQFNELTNHLHPTLLLNVKLFVKNKKFTFRFSFPSVSILLKQAAKLKKTGANSVNTGSVSVRWIYEIARFKSQDPGFLLHGRPLQEIVPVILGTANSMRLELTD
jgi:large subunit ribosomal protein L11